MNHQFLSHYLDTPLIKGRVFDVFEPEKITRDTAVFFVHGGGWRSGSRSFCHEFMQELNNRGYLTASTDYRLNGVTAFEQLQDVREAYDRFVSILKQKKTAAANCRLRRIRRITSGIAADFCRSG